MLDRESNKNVCSVATSGFDMDVQAIAHPKEAPDRIRQTLKTIRTTNPPSNRGWLFHFIDRKGKPIQGSEISTIDTAIFYAGALQAANRLHNKELIDEVNEDIHKIDIQWMIKNSPSGKRICHGLRNGVFLKCEWDEYNEGVVIYHLFNIPYHPTAYKYNLPLFVYYYPLAFIHDQNLEIHLQKAIEFQMKTFGHTGITSMDTEEGYRFYPTDYTSPIALYICGIPTKNPTLHAFSARWESKDRIGIEEGAAVLIKHPLK